MICLEEKKKLLLADYFTEDMTKGGVQTSMSGFCKWKEVQVLKNISGEYASYVSNYPLQGDFHFARSRAISNYISAYTAVNKVDAVIQNSIVAKLERYDAPCISMLNDNNISGPMTCISHRVMGFGDYDLLAGKLLSCQIATCKMSDAVVSVSEHVRDDYRSIGIDSVVINPCIDTDSVLKKDEGLTKKVRSELGLPEKGKVGIIVTSFYPIKGWDVSSALIRKYRDINWIIVNSNNEKLFRNKRDNVLYLGILDRDKLMRVYIAADFMLNTSRYESFCISALEAMASDVPLIMYKTGLCHDKKGVTDFGIVVGDYGEKGFSDAIDAFYGSSYVFEPGYHVESHYNIERWRKGWRNILSSLCSTCKTS